MAASSNPRIRVDFNGARAHLGPVGKPLGRSTLFRRIAEPAFPKPFLDAAGKLQFWLDELDAWLESQPRRQYSDGEKAA